MKNWKKLLSALASPFTLGLVVTAAVSIAAFDYYANRGSLEGKGENGLPSLIQEIHEKTIDWRLNDRGERPGYDQVAILAVDDLSIELEGRWPWPRDKQAKLVDKAMMYGAKSISFDVSYAEEDNNSALPALTRIKNAASKSTASDPGMAMALEDETSKSDLDAIFANTIKAYQDHLVLGAFYLGELKTPGYSELCLNAHYERSYAFRYFKKEARPLTILDAPLSRLQFPNQFKEHLNQYFTQLETDAAISWMEKNPSLTPRITAALESYQGIADPQLYGGLAVLIMSNDFESGKSALEQVDPAFGDIGNVKAMFATFLNAFDRKEQASFKNAIKATGRAYCERFFTGSDELLNWDRWKTLYSDSPESRETFEQFSWTTFWDSINLQNPEAKKETLEALVARTKRDAIESSIPQVDSWSVNHPNIAESTVHTGYFNAIQDTDGSIRRSRLVTRHGDNYAPSLALKTFLINYGYDLVARIDVAAHSRNEKPTKVFQALEIADAKGDTVMQIPTDHRAHAMINYAGKQGMFPHIRASEILNDSPKMIIQLREFKTETGTWEPNLEKVVDKAEFLKDKMLILGATALGVYDLRVTPFEENFPGVETHANVLSNILVEHDKAKGTVKNAAVPGFMKIHPDEPEAMWILLAAIGITLSALLTHFGSVVGLAITAAFLGGVYGLDKFYFFRSGVVTTVLFPISLIVFNYVTLTFYKYFTEERKKRELKGTFEKYVSPAIVAEVLSDPGNIELGGKKMDLTVMFSDVRGFTTISEKLDPRALSDLLNSYLTPMTNLVFEHKGTLDKYMGDAIMAFWGAPIHFPDHAQHAARCALVMLTKLEELRADYRAKGLPDIDIGIGLNTGEMSVGNMGSDTVRSYTVMGDAVNLGSRLEGINKQYGTRIIISEFTRTAIGESFICREVDWVKVKGKAQPVRIFELVAEKSVEEKIAHSLSKFNQGFDLYHQQSWNEAIACFNEALQINPEDACSELYLERCQDYLKEPPPANWDGVFTMTSK